MFIGTNESPGITTTILSTSATNNTTFANETIIIVAKSCTKGPKTYLIFIRVFKLCELKPKSTHTFSHACFSLLNFFGHVIPFWMTWANLIDA